MYFNTKTMERYELSKGDMAFNDLEEWMIHILQLVLMVGRHIQ